MRRVRRIALAVGFSTLVACGGGSGTSSGTPPSPSGPAPNVQPIEVNAGPTNDYANGAFTSVTVCVPGTSDCQTIDGVLIDTGSTGLRLVSSVLRVSLPRQQDSSGAPIAECSQFEDSYEWGPVAMADVKLAEEMAPNVPVAVVGVSGFPHAPKQCASSGMPEENSVSSLGANGILGVGLFRQDCGSACANVGTSNPGLYYACPAAGCHATQVALDKQVQNPIWLFANDNNGVLLQLPATPAAGSPSLSGSMIFGIGTRSNNALGSAAVYAIDGFGDFTTVFQGRTFRSSFIDSGSNAYFFSDAAGTGMPTCHDADFFYCPTATKDFTATNRGANGTSGTVSFSVANADHLFESPNLAFGNLGGPNTDGFDWGLPFFFGRNVFTAIELQSTPAGIGPYFAY
jgi:hypothetical protein